MQMYIISSPLYSSPHLKHFKPAGYISSRYPLLELNIIGRDTASLSLN